MGLLDFFRKKGQGGAIDVATHEHPGHPDEHDAGPPVGVNDPGALDGEDAAEVVAGEDEEQSGY
jgi:hypothetical protein